MDKKIKGISLISLIIIVVLIISTVIIVFVVENNESNNLENTELQAKIKTSVLSVCNTIQTNYKINISLGNTADNEVSIEKIEEELGYTIYGYTIEDHNLIYNDEVIFVFDDAIITNSEVDIY